ncbi:methyl-accepting chemotaxis protein [Pseudorhizobium pelagicum]|uniref:Chemotaxis protein n=1 Tax=Pseudorhizobium pelagicum TaxID=1509405 RepID=A0A922NXT9_9HYPH|nr:PAS domain-containing methyl-accepting chemotaxis protein [Pseudorhizobium pelagicum]KEQ03485.1 chemotaxis protein [Pseudorhizobium pelagicum]KEQ04824.1 chemotaxis protein [Pseudorhizobium pelagicum]
MGISFIPSSDAAAVLAAMGRSQAIIEFDLKGNILTANENFCAVMGYELAEIKGKHHRIFVDPAEAAGAEYKEFWQRLSEGHFDRRQYRRIGKGGREIWIEASYNPVFKRGKPYKVVKFATDITALKLKASEDAGKLSALSRAQAMIEFTPMGDIITANENFLNAMGYQHSEIVGKHHSMFCDPAYVRTEDYARFWERLRGGEFFSEEFTRIGRAGNKVYIQASYNPIAGPDGKVMKVVKFATDVTGRVENVLALGSGLQQLSAGDLCSELSQPFIPSLDQLRTDFNQTAQRLREAMRAIQENAQAIAAGSTEIKSAADDLSKRTEQQAASVEETAAALEEITQTVGDSSRRADEAGRLVKDARKSAENSGEIVTKAIDAMGAIEKSSREITNIIGVIDDIAFQTNLLALNAGVEAARAGEAGKGFAVVAQEVRELAQRSAAAAKEIKTLISLSSEQVRSGVSLVDETGQALARIVAQVKEINTNVEAIVEGSREQAVGLREINVAVNTIDQGTQQNAAMVEQSNAASHSLATEAQALFNLLSQFSLDARETRHQPRQETIRRIPATATVNELKQRVSRGFNGNAAAAQQWEDF